MLDHVEREVLVPANPEEVWKVVTRSGWLAAEVRLELVPGGEAGFSCDDWHRWGWVEEAVPPSSSDGTAGRLTFWWEGEEQPTSRVELTLEPAGDGRTRLRVVEARPLEVLDLVGVPLPGRSAASQGPAMLVAA